MQSQSRPLISIVTPCFNEQENIQEHFARVQKVAAGFGEQFRFEYIYTDNNSSDLTFSLLKEISKENSNVKVMKFSRNVGVNRSIFMGLSQAQGDAVVLIQADLQDPPELIEEFIKQWQSGYDVVFGQIQSRDEGFVLRFLRKCFYFLVSSLAEYEIPRNATEFRLTSKRVNDALMTLNEDDPYIRGYIAFVGFKQKAIQYHRLKRDKGRSSFRLFSLVNYALNGLTATTQVPIRLVSILGVFITTFGFIHILVIVYLRVTTPDDVPAGYTTLIGLITFFSGAQILSLGIIGEYIKKINMQTLNRPKAFVDEALNFPEIKN